MKKSFYNNSNNLIKKKGQNIINIDNKNLIKNNDVKYQLEKKELLINKNPVINNININQNIKPRQIKTSKGSPLSINNKILKQITKIKNKQTYQNIDNIPTVIFNINSNQILESNYKNKKLKNSSESKSKSKSKSNNKSKSNDSNKNKIINYNKSSNQCNLVKKNVLNENNFNGIVKTKTQILKRPNKNTNNNTNKTIINKQLNNNSYNNNKTNSNNPYNFYFNNNQKINIGTSLSLSSNKNNILGLQYLNNLINKNNFNTYKTTPITTKNSVKSSKEKNIQNSNNHKNSNSNDNKKKNSINCKLISIAPKNKIIQKKNFQNNNNLKSLMKKFSISNINKENKESKTQKEIKDKNSENLSSSKNATLIGKNSISNLSNLGNFYSINLLSKSFANSKKNLKKNFCKTKVETKIQGNNNDIQKKSNKYFDNLSNHNIFPITISHCRNNYININININSRKKNIKTTNNNTCSINKVIKNKSKGSKSKNNSKNKSNNLKFTDMNKKKTLSGNNTKIMNKISNKFKINDIKLRLNKNNNINNTNNTNNTKNKNNNFKVKELSCYDLKKANIPITLTSSLLQSESCIKSKDFKKTEFMQVLPKYKNNDFIINENEKKLINHNLTNNENNNNFNLDNIDINSNKNDNNNTFTNYNEFSTISQQDYNYYNEESLKLIRMIKNYGLEHNNTSYPKTSLSYYKIGRSIGHGAFGKVNIALHILSGRIVAIKSFNKIKKSFPNYKISYEIKLLKKLRNHKNIIKYFEHFENDKHFCIVMENISGGNLLSAINKMSKFSEPMAKNIFKQLMETIKFLHSIGIVHRDIKPDNILIELDNTIKLCDFGVSKEVKEGQLLMDSCGTPAFVAPEILKDSPYNPYMTDIWSSGVVLYAMITGFFPFRGVNESDLHRNILSGAFPKLKDVSNELKDLLNKILEVNPNKRITIEDILKHPWLNDVNINDNNNNTYYFNKNINIFTKAEKIIYGKLKIDYRQANKEEVLENFTYHNMETDFEEENLNVKTISFIKTPYNSRRPRDDEEDLFYDDVNIENNIIKFLSKAGELSRLYEVHNNFDFDQGFIISKKDYNNKQKLMSSKNNSYEKEKIKVEKKNKEKNEIINNNINNNNVIENNFISNDDKNKEKNFVNNKKFKINEKIIKFVENFGYNRDFIIKSLQLNEENHAIACYYLGLSIINQ